MKKLFAALLVALLFVVVAPTSAFAAEANDAPTKVVQTTKVKGNRVKTKVSWNAVPGASRYVVYARHRFLDGKTTRWEKVADIRTKRGIRMSWSWTEKAFVANAVQEYGVRAYVGRQKSQIVVADRKGAPQKAPQKVRADRFVHDEESAWVSWGQVASGQKFLLLRQEDRDTWVPVTTVRIKFNVALFSENIGEDEAGAKYMVAAYNKHGVGPCSKVARLK